VKKKYNNTDTYRCLAYRFTGRKKPFSRHGENGKKEKDAAIRQRGGKKNLLAEDF